VQPKQTAPLVLSFVLGAVIGGLAGAFTLYQHWHDRYVELEAASLGGMAYTARLVARGQCDDIAETFFRTAPQSLRWIEHELEDEPVRRNTLRMIVAAYVEHDRGLPEELRRAIEPYGGPDTLLTSSCTRRSPE
jgi:hypothetical protein